LTEERKSLTADDIVKSKNNLSESASSGQGGSVLHQCESGLTTVKIERDDRTEWYITASPATSPLATSPREQVRDVYACIVEKLRAERASILYERVYADRSSWDDVLAYRKESLAELVGFDGGVPSIFDGAPCRGEGLAGVQIWAVSGPDVSPVVENGRVCGREFRAREGSYIVLSDISSLPSLNRREHAEQMFERAATLLDVSGYQFNTDILRTWIYIQDILEWYDDFNRARSTVFRARGITSPSGFLPASTGIGFHIPGGVSCAMDVLALRRAETSGVTIRRCYNPLQNEAPEYGSAFTRGTDLVVDKIRTVLVSGTAAIDEKGRTIHEDDARGQMIRTVENIQALLEQVGMDWSTVSQGTLFVPSGDLVETFHQVACDLRLPPSPLLEVVGTVCRSDLLVEIEVTATAEV
jgi:enamine deaminase RidA (YjgF/YER057c/UK114 family)